MAKLDHFIYLVSSLEEGIAWFESRCGVSPRYGSSHQGLGTHNALLSLGNGMYIELLAIDPEQVGPDDARPVFLGADTPTDQLPRFVAYCIRIEPAGHLAEWCCTVSQECGVDLGQPQPMSRTEIDGTEVSWTLAWQTHKGGAANLPLGGLTPFAIDWGNAIEIGVHPSVSAPGANNVSLLGIYATTPDVAEAKVVLASMLGADHALEHTLYEGESRLRLQINTPKGEMFIG